MSVDEFIHLCTELKALGCAKVSISAEGGTWEAVFPVVVGQKPVTKTEEPPTVDKFKSEDQLREEQYARELGKR